MQTPAPVIPPPIIIKSKELDFNLMSATTSQKLIFLKDEVELNFSNNEHLIEIKCC